MPKYNLYIDGYEVSGSFPEPEAGRFIRAVGDTYEWGPGVLQEQEIIDVSVSGQTEFALSNRPLNDDMVLMFVNGLKQDLNNDYFVNGTTVTYAGDLTLATTDSVEFWYAYIEAAFEVASLGLWLDPDSEEVETETSSPTVFTSLRNRGERGGSVTNTGSNRPYATNIENSIFIP